MHAATMYGPLGALILALSAVSPAGSSPGAVPSPVPAVGAPERAGTARGAAKAADRAAATGIRWHDCPSAEQLPRSVQCGEVPVPLDYAEPDGRQIRLTVSRKRATGPPEERQGPLVYNPGGPGGNGMGFPLFPTVRGELWSELNKAYDFVGYAPRGVGRSAPLSCRAPRRPDEGPRSSSPPSHADKSRMAGQAAAYAEDCARRNGAALQHFTTADNARDLDVLRAALGRRQLHFFGVSWGTYLGAVYATLYPRHVGRFVLDSVVDPRREHIWYLSNLEQNPAFERRWTAWKKWVAAHRSVYRLGRTAQQVQQHFDDARAALRHGHGPVGADDMTTGYLNVAYDSDTWAEHAAALADFHRGNTVPLVQLVHPGRGSAEEAENSEAVRHAVLCSDAPWPREWARWERDALRSGRTAPFRTWDSVRADLPCAYWKAAPSQPVEVGAAPGRLRPVLLVAATGDAATPYRGAVEAHRRLPGSALVTEQGAGQHGVADGNDCVDARIAAHLLHGSTPGTSTVCAARPRPQPDKTDA